MILSMHEYPHCPTIVFEGEGKVRGTVSMISGGYVRWQLVRTAILPCSLVYLYDCSQSFLRDDPSL